MATKSTSTEEVRTSVSSIYADLLDRRNAEREAREAERQRRAEEKRLAKEQEAEGGEEKKKLSKKEKTAAAMKNWQDIIIGLTGDDLDYKENKKSKKKKYKKWIGDEDIADLVPKKKKPKKKNYNKEFEHELSMLKNIVADQNRFTTDLQKRFQNAAGPATKDAMPLNKTLVELAAAVNASRSNSLGYLNAISGIKKTIAELYMKQKKLENDLAGGNGSAVERDLALIGSSIASNMSDSSMMPPGVEMYGVNLTADQGQLIPDAPADTTTPPVTGTPTSFPGITIRAMDPETWDGGGIQVDANVQTESIPKKFVVEKNRSTGDMRMKAVRLDDGTEIPNCPVPTSDLSRLKINEETMTVRGEFAENFELQYVD